MARKRKARVDARLCVACGCCVKVCPKHAVLVQSGVTAYVEPTRCVGCAKCAAACPAGIIAMEEESEV